MRRKMLALASAVALGLAIMTSAAAARGGHGVGHSARGHVGGRGGHFRHVGGALQRRGHRGHAVHLPARMFRRSKENAGRFAPQHMPAARPHNRISPTDFAARRRFADSPVLRSFLEHERRDHHLGWVGPLFWPYAYGTAVYSALWPDEYGYFDPFWLYGYGEIYEGIFSPYSYDEFVQGPDAQVRMTALTRSVAQSCDNEAAEVTDWPIDRIQDTVGPNAQQSALLDDLGNAIVKASEVIKSHCPTTVSFTPTGRLADMQQRLQGLVQAINIVEPPLAKFYHSLSDEQKARFNELGAASPRRHSQRPQASQNPQAECGKNVIAWPTGQINRVVQPNDAQRAKLDVLQSAATQAADMIQAACPSELSSTPPGRLDAEGKRLQAMLQAVQAIRPPLDDFYDTLSDEQKARFNALGLKLFAANRG